MKGFGNKLRRLREDRGLSQRELARLIGIGVMQINRYERGISVPSATVLPQISRLFQMTVDQLIGNDAKSMEPPVIRDVRLFEALRVLDQMPRQERDVVLHLIDAVIAKHKVEEALHSS